MARRPLLRANDAAVSGDARALDRLLAFSDAVVAIAITLIVLPLVDAATDAESTVAFFQQNQSPLLSAALSFVIVAVFWRVHHDLFSTSRGFTPGVLRLQFLWLAAIVFLPVATALEFVGQGQERSAVAIYIGSLLVASVILSLQRILLERSGLIDRAELSLLDRWIGSMLMMLALVMVLLIPAGGAAWLLLLLLEPLLRRTLGR